MGNARQTSNDATGAPIPKSGEIGRRKFKRGPKRPRAGRGKRGASTPLPLIKFPQALDRLSPERRIRIENTLSLHPSKLERSYTKWKKIKGNVLGEEGSSTVQCDRCPGITITENSGGRQATVVADITTVGSLIRCIRCGRWWNVK